MEKVDEIKFPPIIGEYYLVPCIIGKEWEESEKIDYDEQELWMDLEQIRIQYKVDKKIEFAPVINHPHSDRENGQKEVHYHVDSRWEVPKNYNNRIIINNKIRITEGNIRYIPLKCISNRYDYITPVALTKNSKLKHDCIWKGKCPHRGFDLSQVLPINGVITCPLHGLQFDSITKKLLI